MSLGSRINEIRKERGMSIDDLCSLSGVPKGTLSKITAGITTSPTLDTVKAIARALNCRLDDFDDFTEKDEKKAPGPDSSEPRDENEREIISYLRRLLPQQQVFLLALLKTVDGLNQQTQSADPVLDGDRVPVPEFPSQT